MSLSLWTVLGVAIIAVLFYVLGMRVLVRNSRQADRQVDHSKLRPWKDDAGED